MKRTWTIIGVSDVPRSLKWYQSLFGQPETPQGHDHFGQILDTDATVSYCSSASTTTKWRKKGRAPWSTGSKKSLT